MSDGLILAEDWCETADLSTKSCPYMLRRVSNKLLDARHDLVEQGLAIEETAEPRNLSSNGASNFCFCVFQKLDECRNKIPTDDLFVDCFSNLA